MAFLKPCGDFKRNYFEDEAVFQTKFIKLSVGLLLLLLVLMPFVMNEYVLYLMNLVFITIIGAHGINLLVGYTGQVSIGHGAFIGVGAYTVSILSGRYLQLPIWVALPCAGFVTAGIGGIYGVPSLRLKGFYLAMSTLAGQFVLEYLFQNLEGLTGGYEGCFIESPSLFGVSFDNSTKFYYLTLFITILATICITNIMRTRVGRAFIAIKDHDNASKMIGININKYKIMSFIISSFYAGITGGLIAYYFKFVHPGMFTIHLSIEYLAMIIVGGLGSILGSIYGAIFIVVFPEVLAHMFSLVGKYLPRLAEYPSLFPASRMIIFGLAIVIFMTREDMGIAKIWKNIKTYWKLWPFSY